MTRYFSRRRMSGATVFGLIGILLLAIGQDLTCDSNDLFIAPCDEFSNLSFASLAALTEANLMPNPQTFCEQLTPVTVTEFQGLRCSDPPKPVANDHTTLQAIGAGLIEVSQAQVDMLFNDPGAPFAVGQRGDTLTIAPEGSTPMRAGGYVVVASVVMAPFSLTTTGAFNQFGFVFDANNDPTDNFESTVPCDSFNGTDLWVVATLASGGWSMTVTDAANDLFELLVVDARIIVEQNVMVAIVAAGTFAVEEPPYRVTISSHPPGDFLNPTGSIFPPLGELQSFPEGVEQLFDCCTPFGECVGLNMGDCAARNGTIIPFCADKDENQNGIDDACPVPCCISSIGCDQLPDIVCRDRVLTCLVEDFGVSLCAVPCCLSDGTCIVTKTREECDLHQRGTVVDECLDDGNRDGFDDACRPPQPRISCCLPDGACVSVTETTCDGDLGTDVGQCLGDVDENGKDDACEFLVAEPTLMIDDVAMPEGDDGPTLFTFTVTFNPPPSEPGQVDFETTDGTAVAGEDYDAVAESAVFEPGVNSIEYTVTVHGDTDDEEDETFIFTATLPSGATTVAMGTILNNDGPEGDGEFVSCCSFLSGFCEEVPREECTLPETIVASCAGDEENTNGIDDACPVACCLPDGTCGPKPDGECGNRVPACFDDDGDGVTECGVACCRPNGTCSIVSQAECDRVQGTGVLKCLNDGNRDGFDDACEALVRPCCVPDLGCQPLAIPVCHARGGTVLDPCGGVECESFEHESGACCLNGGGCLMAISTLATRPSEICVEAFGGAYQGAGTTCEGVTCNSSVDLATIDIVVDELLPVVDIGQAVPAHGDLDAVDVSITPIVRVTGPGTSSFRLEADILVNGVLVAQDRKYGLGVSAATDRCEGQEPCDGACRVRLVSGEESQSSDGSCGLAPIGECVCQAEVGLSAVDRLTIAPGSTITLVLDPNNLIDEFDEANNVLTIVFQPSGSEIPGDSDGDGDADLPDFLTLIQCFSGAGEPAELGCEALDGDGDGDIDLSDVIAFLGRFTGAC